MILPDTVFMPERPPIQAVGRIVRVLEEDRLYTVEMANGYRAYAIRERKGPTVPAGVDATECEILANFSPYEMSRCKIAEWRPLVKS